MRRSGEPFNGQAALPLSPSSADCIDDFRKRQGLKSRRKAANQTLGYLAILKSSFFSLLPFISSFIHPAIAPRPLHVSFGSFLLRN
jgi:hypothetical protein